MRIVGTNIPDNKKIVTALTYIYGIGPHMAELIVRDAKLDAGIKAKDLSTSDIGKIQTSIEKHCKVEGELRQVIKENVNRLKEIKSYRGTRHMRRLPLKGRTKTNSRTTRGNVRHTAGSGKRKVELK